MSRISDMQFAAAQFGASNRVIADDTGMGGFYVAIPKMTNAQLMKDGDTAVHPAFIVGGEEKSEILIAKYPAFVKNNRAYSLPGVDPKVYVNFDQAFSYCRNKGKGHHLITNAERAMLALWCKINDTMPRGNTNYGASSDNPSEVGIAAAKETSGAFRTLSTKTGPAYPDWYHNGDLSGISDLAGNVWDWCGGLRLMNGKIQVLPNNDAALDTADLGAASTQWKEILAANGSLVEPGTAGTLGFDWIGSKITITNKAITDTSNASRSTNFELLGMDGITATPQIIRSLCLYKNDESGYNNDNVWANMSGERLPLRGGAFYNGASAGVFALHLNDARSFSNGNVGFRAAFVS
ncbi:MAG: formylglycine-generating enzyme family protein [Ruminococcus sp.]|nr:formylglycine-generating enzyme family protein [Ruminococcus sp.]